MIRMLFKSFFKRFLGLFVSMTFVSLLAISLLIAFGSTIVNLDQRYRGYLREYGNIDEQFDVSLTTRENLKKVQTEVEGIERLDVRFSLDTYLKTSPDRSAKTWTARVFSYNENENEIFKRYIISSVPANYDTNTDGSYKYLNAGLARKFAVNNNIKAGDSLVIGYADIYINVYVNEIVATAEGIYPRANEYIWSDNQNFGYLYVNEVEFGKGLVSLADKMLARIDSEPTEEGKASLKQKLEDLIVSLGLPNFLDPDISATYVSKFGNQFMIHNKPGYTQDQVKDAVKAYLEAEGITVKKALTGETLPYRAYMKNAQRQLSVAAIFLPVFFYSTTMIIIGLFMNQIIKNMTSDIGIMMSIGVGKWDIISIFLLFALLIGLTAGVLGSFVGYALNYLLTGILIETYSIPVLVSSISPLISAAAIVGLIVFAEIATMLSCLAIFKITPKDAVISNESKRKKNPKWVEKLIDKSPMNIKLGLNSVFQNPKRFLVSAFSIFASFVLIVLCCNFYLAKEEMIDQSCSRRLNYDAQVYMQDESEQTLIDSIRNLPSVNSFEDCLYTYLKATNGSRSTFLETLAIDRVGLSELVAIPDINGNGNIPIPETGLILPKTEAAELGVSVGDKITVGGVEIEVSYISFQYFHPITYLSKTQMKALASSSEEIKCVSSFLVNIKDENAFADYFSENNIQCLTVYTKNLSKDLHNIFDATNIMIIIMVAFAFGIGFMILSIMSQNSLMEQQRSVSVLRLIGFTVGDISGFWSLTSILQILSSMIIAVPAGIGASMLLFMTASSKSQVYPLVLSFPVFAIALGFIILTVLICHGYSMLSIKRWNLADNTRSRE